MPTVSNKAANSRSLPALFEASTMRERPCDGSLAMLMSVAQRRFLQRDQFADALLR